ncbi:MAG: Ig-like domain-containing protein [Bacteroidia bacterium]
MNRLFRILPCLLLLILTCSTTHAQLSYNFWDYGCDDNRAVDLVGKGMFGNVGFDTLAIPDPGSVLEIAVEAVCKSNCPPTVTFTASQGAATVAAIVQQNGTNGPFGFAKSYRAIFRGSTDSVRISGASGGEFYSFVTYVFRSNTGARQQATMGQFLDNFYFRYAQTLNFNLPAVSGPRDITVTFPVSELRDDNREALFAITAGALTDTTIITTYDTTLGNSFAIVQMTLENVPASTNNLSVHISSPALPGDGDSFHAGVIVEAECPNRGPVAINDINNTLIDTPVDGDVSTNDYEPDGDSTVFTLLMGPDSGSVVFNTDGTYTYTPNSGFVGNDNFTYVICEADNSTVCDTGNVTIKVRDDDPNTPRAPIANDDVAATQVGLPVDGSLTTNDFDPDGDTIAVDTNPISGPNNGSISIATDGSFTYTPNAGFIGTDTVIYRICEVKAAPAVELCDTAQLVITVSEDDNGAQNDPPFAGDDGFGIQMDSTLTGTLKPNDSDPNGDGLVYTTDPIDGPSHGTVTINTDGTFTYVPTAGYYGPDQFVYEVCDDGVPSLCTEATAYITIFPPELFCVTLNVAALLEGPLVTGTATMTTKLNDQGFLPGQAPSGLFPTPTPIGQPYNIGPWNYAGTEGATYGDGAGLTAYPDTVTDWVLVSVRTGNGNPNEEVFKQAAFMLSNGTIQFVGPCFEITDPMASYWVVIEHRNHVGVMTPTAITPSLNIAGNLEINFDFRTQESFVDLFTFGQKQVSLGTYVMYGADPEKTGNQNFEVNGNDNTIWLNNNGQAEIYLQADFNLDAEINGSDNSIWLNNNGIASGVPK